MSHRTFSHQGSLSLGFRDHYSTKDLQDCGVYVGNSQSLRQDDHSSSSQLTFSRPWRIWVICWQQLCIDNVPWANWHMQTLQQKLLWRWHGHRLPWKVFHSVRGLKEIPNVVVGNEAQHIYTLWVTLTTDTPSRGWGAHMLEVAGQGLCTSEDRAFLSTRRKLRAVVN